MDCWKDYFDDWRNDNHTRTINNTSQHNFNCGGYALKTYNWYKPYDNFYDIDDIIDECGYWNYSEEAIEEEILDYMVERILQDFPNLIECDVSAATSKHTVIAFRFGADVDDITDWDFHFKLFENGSWSEKCGSRDIRECELIEDDIWYSNIGTEYTSRIVYFTYKESI